MKALARPVFRPVATGACYVALLLVGGSALRDLPVGLAPDTDLPRIGVSLSWPNTSPREMEALVTARVEAEMQRLPDIQEVSSTSGAGWAIVEGDFLRSTDMSVTEILLRERLTGMRETLPSDLAPPDIAVALPRGMESGRFMILQLSGPLTAEALRETAESLLLPAALQVPGVAGAEVFGGSDREIRVDLNRGAVERGLTTPGDVARLLDGVGGTRSIGVHQVDGARLPVEWERLPADAAAIRAASLPGGTIRLGDVADVVNTWAEPTLLARLDGEPALQLVFERERGANVLDVASRVSRAIQAVVPRLPPGVVTETVYDQSERVREELRALVRRSVVSVLAILAVLTLFHRRVRAPFVVFATVLFSALATFLLFRAAGLGLNLVTISGLALSFGMAVDNSIIIFENISLRTRGLPGRLRSVAATREVLFPLLAATLTTAIVLTPFLYLSEDLEHFYLPFALAVCFSLVASMFVAVTLTPLLSRWALRKRVASPRPRADRRHGRAERLLAISTRRPLLTVVLATALLAGSLWAFDRFVSRGSIFPPATDTELRVSTEFPPGGETAQADALIRQFESHVLDHEFFAKHYVTSVQALVRERTAFLAVRFHPAVTRTTIPQILRDELTARAAAVSGVAISVQGQGPGYSSGGTNVSPFYQVSLRGPDYLELDRLTNDVAHRLERNGRVKNVDKNLAGMMTKDATILTLSPDRARMAILGVDMASLIDFVNPAISSDLARRPLRDEAGELDARVRYRDGDRLTPQAFRNALLTVNGSTFSIGEVASIDEEALQSEIRRRDQQYERTIGFEYRGPRKIGNRFAKSIIENTTVPPGYTIEDGGGIFLSTSDERAILLAVAFAAALVYMVSAALFESLILPFVALFSVPLSFVGVALVFILFGEPFDRTAYVGLILLVGIAINNGLIYVHRAGAMWRKTGRAREAAVRAAAERARPILMTTATSVAGLLPLAWQADAGTVASWRSLALAGSGGLLASAAATLFVLPGTFTLLAERRRRPPIGRNASDSTRSSGS